MPERLSGNDVELDVARVVPFAGTVEARDCVGEVAAVVTLSDAALEALGGSAVPDVGCPGGGMVCPKGPPPADEPLWDND